MKEISAKKGGLHVKIRIDEINEWRFQDHPPKEGSTVRVACVRGTRPGLCVACWMDADGKRWEANGVMI